MENSAIAWTKNTWNFWEGCTKIAKECENCYALDRNNRFAGGANWGPGKPRRRTVAATANAPLKWNKQAVALSEIHLVFTMSLGDWADEEVGDDWRHEMFGIIEQCKNLTFQMLTKRPANAARFIRERYNAGTVPQNMWLGVSAGVKKMEAITEIDVPVHFISAEPYIRPFVAPRHEHGWKIFDWVIFGGESGKNARPCDLVKMVEDIEKTRATGAKIFVKQLGAKPYIEHPPMRARKHVVLRDGHGGDMSEWPDLVPKLREFPEGFTGPVKELLHQNQ